MSSKTMYYCDRCGKEIERYIIHARRFVKFGNAFSYEWETSKYELCKDCNDNLKKFLEGEKLVSERVEEIGEEISKLHENHVAD